MHQNNRLIEKLQELVDEESDRFSPEEKEFLREAIIKLQDSDGQTVNTEIFLTILKAFGPLIYEVIKHMTQ